MTANKRLPSRLVVLWGLASGVVGVGAWLLVRGLGGDSPTAATSPRPPVTATQAQEPPIANSGPARLRDGAHQLADPIGARVLASEALDRVEAELRATRDPAEVQRILRKRELIRQAIERLDDGGNR